MPEASAEMTAILEFGRAHPTPDHEDIEERCALAAAAITGPLAEGTAAEEALLGSRTGDYHGDS